MEKKLNSTVYTKQELVKYIKEFYEKANGIIVPKHSKYWIDKHFELLSSSDYMGKLDVKSAYAKVIDYLNTAVGFKSAYRILENELEAEIVVFLKYDGTFPNEEGIAVKTLEAAKRNCFVNTFNVEKHKNEFIYFKSIVKKKAIDIKKGKKFQTLNSPMPDGNNENNGAEYDTEQLAFESEYENELHPLDDDKSLENSDPKKSSYIKSFSKTLRGIEFKELKKLFIDCYGEKILKDLRSAFKINAEKKGLLITEKNIEKLLLERMKVLLIENHSLTAGQIKAKPSKTSYPGNRVIENRLVKVVENKEVKGIILEYKTAFDNKSLGIKIRHFLFTGKVRLKELAEPSTILFKNSQTHIPNFFSRFELFAGAEMIPPPGKTDKLE